MADRISDRHTNTQSVAQIYLDELRRLAAEHSPDYAMVSAASTMALLLSMSSMAMYRLSAPPLVMPALPVPSSEHPE